jgi:hypothetical protein
MLIFHISKPFRPPWPVTGIALLFLTSYFRTILKLEKYTSLRMPV